MKTALNSFILKRIIRISSIGLLILLPECVLQTEYTPSPQTMLKRQNRARTLYEGLREKYLSELESVVFQFDQEPDFIDERTLEKTFVHAVSQRQQADIENRPWYIKLMGGSNSDTSYLSHYPYLHYREAIGGNITRLKDAKDTSPIDSALELKLDVLQKQLTFIEDQFNLIFHAQLTQEKRDYAFSQKMQALESGLADLEFQRVNAEIERKRQLYEAEWPSILVEKQQLLDDDEWRWPLEEGQREQDHKVAKRKLEEISAFVKHIKVSQMPISTGNSLSWPIK